MLTADNLVDQALSRVGEYGVNYPSTRGPMYRRIGYRQRQLYVMAAQVNPEYIGTCATAALSGGAADLNDVVAPVPTPELIQRVEIADHGTSAYTDGQRVNVVAVQDQEAELAPRILIRDRVIYQVGTDLANVTSLRIYFPRLPDLFLLTDSAKVVELEAPWDTLLELDLVKWLVHKATKTPEEERAAVIATFDAEEKALLAEWLQHVAAYSPIVSRYLPPRVFAWNPLPPNGA